MLRVWAATASARWEGVCQPRGALLITPARNPAEGGAAAASDLFVGVGKPWRQAEVTQG